MIGENIKHYRMVADMTQDELARRLNIAKSTVSSWEVNRTEPSFKTIETIAGILGCNYIDLVGGSSITMDSASFSAFTKQVNNSIITEDEQLILDTYRSLSQVNKMKLYAYMEGLK